MLFLKSNIKKISLALIISVLFTLILLIVFTSIIGDNMKYYIPDNYIFVSQNYDSIETYYDEYDVDITPVNQLSMSGYIQYIYNPYEVELPVFLNELVYSKSATEHMILDVKKLMNNGENLLSYRVRYINFPDDMDENINYSIETQNIKGILAGNFPKSNEVLIDETLANYLIEDRKLKAYEDLVGTSLEMKLKDCSPMYCHDKLRISGVYEAEKVEKYPKLIVNPSQELYNDLKKEDEIEEEYFVRFNDMSEKKEFIEDNINMDMDIVSSEDIPKVNIELTFKILPLVIGMSILTILILKDIKYWHKVIKYNHLSKVKYIYIMNIYIVYLFLGILLILII